MVRRIRYALAGTGARGLSMFARPLLTTYAESCELAGLFDRDLTRMQGANGLLGTSLPTYTDFDVMLREVDPDVVIVATMDSTHAQYIMRTLQAGKRAISEKPMCTDAEQVREILAAAEQTTPSGAFGLVTHNERYTPAFTEIKRLIGEGTIGEILTITFQEDLDRRHGADYFRRWHRYKANSGGLLIHKSSHHFDVLNWLVESKPDTLVAQGGLLLYGKNGPFRSERCTGCPHTKRCDFHVDLWTEERNRQLYRNAESDTGYIRDRCVFAEDIDIEDQAGVLYTYENGVRVVYRLTAFASYEGMDVKIEGTEGRLEYQSIHKTSWALGKLAVPGVGDLASEELRLFRFKSGVKTVPIPHLQGEHGGADAQLRDDFFGRPLDAPFTQRQASLSEAGQAVLIGDAANRSIANQSQQIVVQDLLKR